MTTRVYGIDGWLFPVEHMALDADGSPVVSVGTVGPVILASITRESDGATYDWGTRDFSANPLQPVAQLVEFDGLAEPGLWIVDGGAYLDLSALSGTDTYTVSLEQDGGPDVATLPESWSMDVGPMPYDLAEGEDPVSAACAIADDLRGLAYDLGARPWDAWVLEAEWSSGAAGRGARRCVACRKLLPAPYIDAEADGSVWLRHISTRYLDTRLAARDAPGCDSIVLLVPAAGSLEWAAYVPAGAPVRDPAGAAGLAVRLGPIDALGWAA